MSEETYTLYNDNTVIEDYKRKNSILTGGNTTYIGGK